MNPADLIALMLLVLVACAAACGHACARARWVDVGMSGTLTLIGFLVINGVIG